MAVEDAHTSAAMPGKANWPQWDHEHHDLKEHAIMLKLSMDTMLKLMDEGHRPPNDEVAAALRAAMGFADKATKEPKLQTVLDEVRKLAIESNNRETDINEKITHIKHQATSLGSTPSIASYASVLGRSSTASSTTGGAPLPILPPAMPKQGQSPYNKQNEIVIKLQDQTASKALEGKTTAEMTTIVNGYIQSTDISRKLIRTARRLPSGDIYIIAANEKEAAALREHKDWVEKLSSNARVVTKTYGILLHGVRFEAIDTKDIPTAIRAVQIENANTLSLDIVWLGWFGTPKNDQHRGSLIIELASPEEGNRAMEEGLVIGSELHGCCVYNNQCRSKQCFECWQYGHLSTSCPKKGEPVCGKCSGGHHHKECTEQARKCPVCKGPHEAWNKICVAKKREIARMRQARMWTPTRFATPKDQTVSHQIDNQSSYFQNATTQLKDISFPQLSAGRGIPPTRAKGASRGGHGTPDLRRMATPNLQATRRSTATSPTRSSPRSRSPSKATRVAEDYEKGIAAGEINNLEERRPLSQLSNNERVAVPAAANAQKRHIQAVSQDENTPEGMDWEGEATGTKQAHNSNEKSQW